jgi:alpha-beta hydrolase superfamily lysophospholipase
MLVSAQAFPAPTLFLFASTGADTLTADPYRHAGLLLYAQGWNVVSLDLPCHGSDQRPGEPPQLQGWAARVAAGEDIVAPFQSRVTDVLDHLIISGRADPARICAAGTSRGGCMAFQAAAGDPRIRSVAAFAPVTDLLALSEFAGQEGNTLAQRLALRNAAGALADRAAWLIIGNHDERVDTDRAIAFSRALVRAAVRRDLPPRVTLQVTAEPGHTSTLAWHEQAAEWLMRY